MLKVVKLTVVVFCGLLIVASSASAQRKDGNFKFSVRLKADQTDNRDSTMVGESNLDILVSPKIEGNFDFTQGILKFHYMPTMRFRSDPSITQNEDSWQHNVGVDASRKISEKTKVRIYERYIFSDDPSIIESGATLRGDSSFSLNRLSASVDHRFNREVKLHVMGSHSDKSYDDEGRSMASDEDSATGSATLWRQMNKSVGIKLIGHGAQYNYNEMEGVRGFSVASGRLGVEKLLADGLRGYIHAGMDAVSYDDPEIESDTKPFVNITVKGKVGAKTVLALSGVQTVRESYVDKYASQDETSLSARVDWAPNHKVTIGAGAVYRMGSYEAETIPMEAIGSTSADRLNVSEVGGDENTTVAYAEARVNVSDFTQLSLRQQFEDVDSDVYTSFDKSTTSVACTFKF